MRPLFPLSPIQIKALDWLCMRGHAAIAADAAYRWHRGRASPHLAENSLIDAANWEAITTLARATREERGVDLDALYEEVMQRRT